MKQLQFLPLKVPAFCAVQQQQVFMHEEWQVLAVGTKTKHPSAS